MVARCVIPTIRNVSEKGCRENQKTHCMSNNVFRISCRLRGNVKKYGRPRQATDDFITGRMRYTSSSREYGIPCLQKTIFIKISRNVKLQLYNKLIRPTVTYASETWVLKENMTNKLMIFERKIMRKIFGTTRTHDGYWRIKTIQEITGIL